MISTGLRAITLLCLLVAAGATSAHDAVAPAASPALDPAAALQTSQAAIGRSVADRALLDHDGKPVRLAGYRGKPLLVSFVYTGCFQVCPTSTHALLEAVRAMRASIDPGQFNVVSIGFNQPADSPQAMKAFALQQRIDLPNWAVLSAPATVVDDLTRDFGFVFKPTQAGFDHLLQVSIVDAEGRIYAQVYGDDFSADRLGEPLRRLLRNQPMPPSVGLADVIDRVRVLCSVYDPVSGQYRVSYALAFELAGGLTFMVAMLWFFALEWRERRRLRHG